MGKSSLIFFLIKTKLVLSLSLSLSPSCKKLLQLTTTFLIFQNAKQNWHHLLCIYIYTHTQKIHHTVRHAASAKPTRSLP